MPRVQADRLDRSDGFGNGESQSALVRKLRRGEVHRLRFRPGNRALSHAEVRYGRYTAVLPERFPVFGTVLGREIGKWLDAVNEFKVGKTALLSQEGSGIAKRIPRGVVPKPQSYRLPLWNHP